MPVLHRPALRTAAATAALGLALTGCTTTASGGDSAGGGSAGGGSASDLDCDGVTTAGWELMVDPRVTVDPAGDVVPLTKAGESLTITDTAPDGYTTYSYQLGYIDDAGTVFPNKAEIMVGAEDTNSFTLEGPFAPTMIDGGPYAGIIQVDATDDAGTHTIARICVQLAVSE